jgi:CRP-like cAMP-binding protein
MSGGSRAGKQGVLAALRRVPLFAALGRPELASIASVVTSRDVAAGGVICAEGEPGAEFFVIRSGRVRVDQGGRKKRELAAGEFFGELALLDRGPRSATVTAISDVALAVISEQDFSMLIDEVPAVAHKLLAHLAGLVRETEARGRRR